MKISRAIVEDTYELNDLINSSYRGDTSRKGWTTEADLIDGDRIDVVTLHQYFEDECVTILKAENENGAIVGCVYLRREAGYCYLGMLTVSPILQAMGIGRSLLKAGEEYARICSSEKITMTVISARAELVQWYERRGYVKTGEKEPFHPSGKVGQPRFQLELLVLEKVLIPS